MKPSKNIHILPTSQPSRLYINSNKNLVVTKLDYGYPPCRNVNIYITNLEEIKEGEHNVPSDFSKISDIGKTSKEDLLVVNDKNNGYKKIILTNDKKLIADGVQELPEEFYSWFIENPSCEYVEVERNFADEGIKGITYYGKYFIIIPKEEPKFEDSIEKSINIMSIANSMFSIKQPKQNTMSEELSKTAEQIQNECHKFVESVPNLSYQDATNVFIFMKLAELTTKLKEYERQS